MAQIAYNIDMVQYAMALEEHGTVCGNCWHQSAHPTSNVAVQSEFTGSELPPCRCGNYQPMPVARVAVHGNEPFYVLRSRPRSLPPWMPAVLCGKHAAGSPSKCRLGANCTSAHSMEEFQRWIFSSEANGGTQCSVRPYCVSCETVLGDHKRVARQHQLEQHQRGGSSIGRSGTSSDEAQDAEIMATVMQHFASNAHYTRLAAIKRALHGKFSFRPPPTGCRHNFEYHLCKFHYKHDTLCPWMKRSGTGGCTHATSKAELEEWNIRRLLCRRGLSALAIRPDVSCIAIRAPQQQ